MLPPSVVIKRSSGGEGRSGELCGRRASERAVCAMPIVIVREFACFTANSLNCTVYSCLGILDICTPHFAYPNHTGLEDEIPGEAQLANCELIAQVLPCRCASSRCPYQRVG